MTRSLKLLTFNIFLSLMIACAGMTFSVSQETPDQSQDETATVTPKMGNSTSLEVTQTVPVLGAEAGEFPRPTPTAAAMGTVQNPIVLALPPGSASDEERVNAGKALAEQLSEITGFTYVVVAPESYAKLVESLGKGNAHIAVLSGAAYGVAYENKFVNSAFASTILGEKTFGAQFIARTDAGFKSYYDAFMDINTADAATALSQFRDKKPCWPDEVSLSGYVIPKGVLANNNIPIRQAALVQGQPTVVQAVFASDICDFGATYIDARSFPSVIDKYPDVLDEVKVIWRVPSVIPYDVLVLARSLSPKVSLAVSDALFRITGMEAGKRELGRAYGTEEWEQITDAFYEEFRLYLDASDVELETLLY